jgi:hypothetical protein
MAKDLNRMVRHEKFELSTFSFVARRSIRLSYGRKEGFGGEATQSRR